MSQTYKTKTLSVNSEEDPLLNVPNTVRKYYNCYKFNIFCLYFLILIIISIQSLSLYYFVWISDIFENLNNINTSDVNSYINKTKLIIDYVCSNMITC